MKINKINNIQFAKKLIAKADVIKNDNPEKVNIYELEYGVDNDYFNKARNDENWKRNFYLGDIEAELIYCPNDAEKIYSMEDSDGNILGLSEVTNHTNAILLDYIETAPEYSINAKGRRTFKYIGETMLAFIASLCKKEGKSLQVPDVIQDINAQNFYFKNCGLENVCFPRARLKKENMDIFLNHNKNHTGSNIELVG